MKHLAWNDFKFKMKAHEAALLAVDHLSDAKSSQVYGMYLDMVEDIRSDDDLKNKFCFIYMGRHKAYSTKETRVKVESLTRRAEIIKNSIGVSNMYYSLTFYQMAKALMAD